jgi:outer membrane receptor protein involved in Fe transport
MHGTRTRSPRQASSLLNRLPLATAIYFALGSMAFAQAGETAPAQETPASTPQQATPNKPTKPTEAPVLGTVTVTAQKRVENLQKVPISIDVLGQEKLEQHNVADFTDFALLLPSVSFGSSGGGVFPGPGFVQVYMRGVSSGDNANHSSSQPSVGMYLDEQPITTIQGSLDIHVYDVARIEALAGPQGTLYGASSQAGTVRIITNKPDPTATASGFTLEGNTIDGGGNGYVAEGFLNLPIADHAAIRLVGWSEHKAGWVDNVLGSRTFPSWDADSGGHGTITNTNRAKDNYNVSDVVGARAALRIDLNDNWTVTPTIMGQHQKSEGSNAYEPRIGDLALTHFYPESADDKWTQAALTVQGKIGNFELTYAFSHLKRDVDSESDYNDYGYWYDVLPQYAYGSYFYDDNGDLVNPSQYIQATDGYKKTSHELRISSPAEDRFRFVAGVFWQDQKHEIFQRYRIDNLAAAISVPNYEDTIWLTAQERNDRDKAVFGELTYDLTDKLTVTGGMRFFKNENSLRGFFGFGAGYSSSTGEAKCFSSESVNGSPCLNLDKQVSENGSIGKFNITYQVDDDRMVYFTWSEGYRPGGINRRDFHTDGSVVPPYKSDYLTNYELGWKTTWANKRLSFNGAVFQEDWKDFQFSFLGQNGLTEILNAPQARIRGLEADVAWAATYNLAISGGLALYDAKLTSNYCKLDFFGQVQTTCSGDELEAPAGTQLPITAKVKGNLTARYTFEVGGNEAFVQGAAIHQGKRFSDLRLIEREILGDLEAYTLFDLSAGIKHESWSLDFFLKNAFDKRAQLGKFAACRVQVCGGDTYTIAAQPRTFGVRFSREF